MTNIPEEKEPIQRFQDKLAMAIVAVSILGIVVLAIAVILISSAWQKGPEDAFRVLSTLLPVFSTWVGVVLAFYFGRENYESAARIAQSVAMKPERFARDFAIADPKFKVVADKAAADALLVAALQAEMVASTCNRLPIVNANRIPIMVIHKSTIDAYLLANPILAGATDDRTVGKLILSPQGTKLSRSFALLPQTATIHQAQAALANNAEAQDLFLTADGRADQAVLHWLTNNEIEKAISAST